MNTSAMEGYKCQAGAFIKTECTEMLLCILSLLREGAVGHRDRSPACPWHLRLWVWAVSSSLCPGSFWVPSARSSCPQDEARGWVPLEMLLNTATMGILKHRPIKMCNLHDTAGYGQYLCLNLEAEERQARLIIFYLLTSFLSQFPQTHEISCLSTCNPSFGLETSKELSLC